MSKQPDNKIPTGSVDGQPAAGDAGNVLESTDSMWYKDAIIYQAHVKAFGDSNGDGIGDFRGLTERLDYIQQLGVNTLWLLPFYPSPQRDDGYDIASYCEVHADYGTMDDCQTLIEQAHAHGLRVITELIINHTSDQHPWFQAARTAPKGSPEREFYVWSDDDTRYSDSRIIFTDTEVSNWAWDPVAKQYYWHRFFSHQPDLNFDNPKVLEAVLDVMSFWLDMGVDGLRLDAIPYLIEREGTSSENLPETHAVLQKIRAALDEHYTDRMFLAEANQWPEDVREYFAEGNECHMAYHFPLMPRMYMAVAQEDRFPIIDIMEQTPDIPENCQWAIFLRNHDELTLEMVTAREREYMYRTYANDPRMRINVGIRRRLAPLLDNDLDKIKLMNSLLLSLLGTPVLYYGDEIGMGDNIYLGDRNGVRTPMQWSPDRNAGFSRADPQRLYLPPIMDPSFGYQAVNVEAQSRSPASLLNWMRRLISVRKQHLAFGRGRLRFLAPENRHILAYLRQYETEPGQDEVILCVANLSRSPQPVELDLSEFEGLVPVELTARTEFPQIGALPYLLTLPGHDFYWFELAHSHHEPAWHADHVLPTSPPLLVLSAGLDSLLDRSAGSEDAGHLLSKSLERLMPEFIAPQRWFAAKGEPIRAVTIERLHHWSHAGGRWLLMWLNVHLHSGDTAQEYFVPLSLVWDDEADDMIDHRRAAVLTRVRRHARMGVLCDAFADTSFCRALAMAMAGRCVFDFSDGTLVFQRTGNLALLLGLNDGLGDDADDATNAAFGTGPTASPAADQATPQSPDPDDDALIQACSTLTVELPATQGSNSAVVLARELHWQDPEGRQPMQVEGEGAAFKVFLKAYRRLRTGQNPEFEIGRFLDRSVEFDRVAPLAGGIEWIGANGHCQTLAIAQNHVVNQGDAWDYTLDCLIRIFDAHVVRQGQEAIEPENEAPTSDQAGRSGLFSADGVAAAEIGAYAAWAAVLGRRTAQMHRAFLSAPADDAAFAAEPLADGELRRWSENVQEAVGSTLDKLDTQRDDLPQYLQPDIDRLLHGRHQLSSLAQQVYKDSTNGAGLVKCRYHGDFHLQQVLLDREDVIIIDFEGEPGRSVAERREKHSPLKDVAGMLRSFDYAAGSALLRAQELWADTEQSFEPLIREWQRVSNDAFLKAYRDAAEGSVLWPETLASDLLNLLVLDKALYELRYELDHRRLWVRVPLQGLLRLSGTG